MKRIMLMVFSLLMLMMCWEGQLTSANVMDNGPIPQQSIRLRIIANSDSFQDQWLKREVRDALIVQMNKWAGQIGSYEEAKKVVGANLPQLQEVVDQTIRDRGFSYAAKVDFGRVPFPTKLYGTYVYPAGNYEALRVQIGEAQGQNWWCVLFPPLCFIDMSNGDAVQAAEPAGVTEQAKDKHADAKQWQERRQLRLEERGSYEDRDSVASIEKSIETSEESIETSEEPIETSAEVNEAPPAPQVQVKFFIWEKLEKLFS